MAEYRDKLARGMLPVYENVTFGEMADLLCNEYKPMISEGVRKQYVSICKNHLAELKHMRLTELRNAHLQTIINRMAPQVGLEPTTLRLTGAIIVIGDNLDILGKTP